MNRPTIAQGIIKEYTLDTYLLTWIEAFLFDRKVQNLAKGTLDFYRRHLNLFIKFCDSQMVTQVDQLDPNLIRQYMVWLEEKGHNPGALAQLIGPYEHFYTGGKMRLNQKDGRILSARLSLPRLP
jgi:site-specific recombinase XerD